jgi:15-cis-phytoene synthase
VGNAYEYMLGLYHKTSEECSKIVTSLYSTSFYSAINLLHKDLRNPICNIYGFVRFADEIVDTFHQYDKQQLLSKFKQDTYAAIREGISLNPILHSFQKTFHEYQIDLAHVDAFIKSMEMDLTNTTYGEVGYQDYIYGSAEVVGLMCLHVFCDKDPVLYKELVPSARSLGAAFQKVNFLRDLKADFEGLNRTYFPNVNFTKFSEKDKRDIESDIQKDFDHALTGIKQLPSKSKLGVFVAYRYYLSLHRRIIKTSASAIMVTRIRVPDYQKALIVVRAGIQNQLKQV